MKIFIVSPYRKNLAVGSDTTSAADCERMDLFPSEAILILTAVLREAGHAVINRDYTVKSVASQDNPKKYAQNDALEIIKRENIKLVGISYLFSGDFDGACELARMIKAEIPDVKIITGGIHPTTFPREILSNIHDFDYIAIGEGENIIVEIANRMEKGDMGDLTEIPGFAFRDDNNTVHVNEIRKQVDFDALPMRAWDTVNFSDYEMNLESFFNPKKHDIKCMVSIFSERGCPFQCSFCELFRLQGRTLRKRSISKFVDELQYLVEERGQRYFRFQDDNLIVDNRHVISLCNEIVKRSLDIQLDVGGGHVNSYNDDVIDSLHSAGLVSTTLNIEHGSEYMRDKVVKKPIGRDKIFKVIESLRRYKISIGTNWIMGFPEDTDETLQETYDLINETKADRSNVGTLVPFPGTPIFDQCVRDDLFIEKIDINEIWRKGFRPNQGRPVIKPYNMSVASLLEWRDKFAELRYKYYGHTINELPIPKGFARGVDGAIRPL